MVCSSSKPMLERKLVDLGTDPQMVQNVLNYKADPGDLRPYLSEEQQKLDKVPRASILAVAGRGAIGVKIAETGLQGCDKEDYLFDIGGKRTEPFVSSASLPIIGTYKARPLNGVWATGPFLHNGSVPNLYQLLLPPEQRIKKFKVGSQQFDPVKVGFVIDQGSEFDTTDTGNKNGGHSGPKFTQVKGEDGNYRDLTDDERMALIEYMKTLI